MSPISFCPLTKSKGRLLRSKQPRELFELYDSYCGASLPEEFFKLYFNQPVFEFFSDVSGLRWYEPGLLGNGDYYAALSKIYPWYYNPGSWDKQTALEIISSLNPQNILEVGCGDGWLLEKLRERNLNAYGVEINESAVQNCRARGLNVFLPGEDGLAATQDGVLCLLQTIEHVPAPGDFASSLVRQYRPQHIIMSAPCFEGLLGYTNDPLSWPPHHATAWSRKAFETLAGLLGYTVSLVSYSPLSYEELGSRFEREGKQRIKGIPHLPKGRVGALLFKMYQHLGSSWACRGHSILVVLKRKL